MSMSLTLGCVQPSYIAWLPFFQRMILSDVFVYLDDVQFSKNSSHNKNSIKTSNGSIVLTVPIKYSGNSSLSINKMPIENKNPWIKKHWRSIEMNYSKAPHFKEFAEVLHREIYSKDWEFLGNLNIHILETIRNFLLIPTSCIASSSLEVNLKSNEKLVEICKLLGANSFLVKPETNDYHPKDYFEQNGIGLKYFTYNNHIYPQLHKGFIPGLSIIDIIMNCGKIDTKSYLMKFKKQNDSLG